MRTISIINLKGGVGKTVTSINMAYELMQRDSRVLLIDCDKQGNTSKFMKCHNYDKKSLSDVLLGTADIMEVSVRTRFALIDVVPANMSLLKADRQVLLDTTKPQQSRIREALEQIQNKYTYCIIDCAPDINISVINALVASDDVMIPVTIDKFAFDGIREILEQIHIHNRKTFRHYLPILLSYSAARFLYPPAAPHLGECTDIGSPAKVLRLTTCVQFIFVSSTLPQNSSNNFIPSSQS